MQRGASPPASRRRPSSPSIGITAAMPVPVAPNTTSPACAGSSTKKPCGPGHVHLGSERQRHQELRGLPVGDDADDEPQDARRRRSARRSSSCGAGGSRRSAGPPPMEIETNWPALNSSRAGSRRAKESSAMLAAIISRATSSAVKEAGTNPMIIECASFAECRCARARGSPSWRWRRCWSGPPPARSVTRRGSPRPSRRSTPAPRRRRRLSPAAAPPAPPSRAALAPAAGAPAGRTTGRRRSPARSSSRRRSPRSRPKAGTLYLVARRISDNPSARGTLIAVKKLPATTFPLPFALTAADMPFQNGPFDGELTLHGADRSGRRSADAREGRRLRHAPQGPGRRATT